MLEIQQRSLQDWFDAAWRRAAYPRRSHIRSDNGKMTCIYSARGDNPGCFVGVSMTPEQALDSDKRRVTAFELARLHSWTEVEANFLLQLQRIHDGVEPSFWELALRNLAHDYRLRIPGESCTGIDN